MSSENPAYLELQKSVELIKFQIDELVAKLAKFDADTGRFPKVPNQIYQHLEQLKKSAHGTLLKWERIGG